MLMKYLKCLLCFFSLLPAILLHSQTIEPADITNSPWKASWISVPGEPASGYGIYLFRKSFELSSVPSSFIVHVSGDNRYKLYINKKLVSLGPARSDLAHWNYETVDLGPFLQTGKNSIAALVWNEAEWRPEAQISNRTGFILQGATAASEIVNSDTSWRCARDSSYQPIRVSIPTYYVTGPGELIDMKLHARNWEDPGFDDHLWKRARTITNGTPKNLVGNYGISSAWMLVASTLPQMERTVQRLAEVRRAEGIAVPPAFPATATPVIIPANTSVTLLLDQRFLTNAYPTFIFSKGKDAGISLSYAESMYIRYPVKGNRNEIEGKQFIGRKDSIISDGSLSQVFTPLSWRTYRYIQLKVTTKDDPLTIDDIYGTFTGYPFEYKARLESENPELGRILDIGWRTARLCAVETYMDCPYYEQLQYIGDTRIQALVSLYNSGDDRLVKNALNLMDNSRQPEGVTESRHPSYTPQYIPTFSLLYLGMLHDYWMYGKDSNFIKDKLSGERQVLNYFHKYQQADGSLKGVPYWLFTDWVETRDWSSGASPSGKEGTSAVLDLQLLMAYQVAAMMESRMGLKEYAAVYTRYAEQLKRTIRSKYWDDKRKLFADRPAKDLFSQHANALAILTDAAIKTDVPGIAKQLLTDTSLAPASIYFKYYLHRALIKAGLGDQYLDWLDKWRENISMGLTTWAEAPNVNTSRSDCHAWGSSPNIEIFRTVLGIDSDAPAFTKIKVEPHLGKLRKISGEIPHPNGRISTAYEYKDGQWRINISLPVNTSGSFVWKGKVYGLKAGANTFRVN